MWIVIVFGFSTSSLAIRDRNQKPEIKFYGIAAAHAATAVSGGKDGLPEGGGRRRNNEGLRPSLPCQIPPSPAQIILRAPQNLSYRIFNSISSACRDTFISAKNCHFPVEMGSVFVRDRIENPPRHPLLLPFALFILQPPARIAPR